MTQYDTIVIGGGPSGLMAAISAAEAGARTLLLEKGKKLGTKLAISGGGRCNVTNRLPIEEIIRHIPGNGKFLYGPFSVFNNEDIIAFFENLGVELKEEDHGRMFPKSNSAKSVVNALINRLNALNVIVRMNTPVEAIDYKEDFHTVILSNGEKLTTTSVIIAVGGKSVPHTGSTGDGYAWAKKAGHTITDLFPTEVALTSNESFIKEKTLQGLSLSNVALSVLNKKDKPIITHTMDMIFTHFGISGPAVLRCSQFVVKEQMKRNEAITMHLDILPEETTDSLTKHIRSLCQDNPKKALKNILKGTVPDRLLQYMFKQLQINENKNGSELSKKDLQDLIFHMKNFKFKVNGTLPMEKSFVTGGGVSTKEIHPKTMASKKINGLFFCGEILNIHGYTGGYNITCALVTGKIAGMNSFRKQSNLEK